MTSWWCELGAGAAITVVPRRFPTARPQLVGPAGRRHHAIDDVAQWKC